MKKVKSIAFIIALAILSAVSLSNAQRGWGHGGGHHGGGYYGRGNYGGYNGYGYAGAPYRGVVTGPAFSVNFGRPYRDNCSYHPYWHKWRCW